MTTNLRSRSVAGVCDHARRGVAIEPSVARQAINRTTTGQCAHAFRRAPFNQRSRRRRGREDLERRTKRQCEERVSIGNHQWEIPGNRTTKIVTLLTGFHWQFHSGYRDHKKYRNRCIRHYCPPGGIVIRQLGMSTHKTCGKVRCFSVHRGGTGLSTVRRPTALRPPKTNHPRRRGPSDRQCLKLTKRIQRPSHMLLL
jgi:hypothetical protein